MTPVIVTAPSRSWVVRGPLLVLAVVCLLGGVGYLADSARTVITASTNTISIAGPGASIPGLSSRLRKSAATTNGINFAAGVMLCLAGLLALNRGMPGTSRGGGAVDRGLARVGGFGVQAAGVAVPALLILTTVVWLGYLLVARTNVHWDATAAAAAFKRDVAGYDLAVTGNVMYARAIKGPVVHMAAFTPALVRALDRAQVGVGGLVRPREYPLPGVVPVLVLAGVAAVAFVKRRRGSWRPVSPGAPDTMAARAFLVFALLNLYVVVWIVSGQRGVFFREDILHPEWVGMAITLLLAGLGAIAALHRKIEANGLPYATRAGWLFLFFAVSLAAPCGATTSRIPTRPLQFCSGCWRTPRPAPPAELTMNPDPQGARP